MENLLSQNVGSIINKLISNYLLSVFIDRKKRKGRIVQDYIRDRAA